VMYTEFHPSTLVSLSPLSFPASRPSWSKIRLSAARHFFRLCPGLGFLFHRQPEPSLFFHVPPLLSPPDRFVFRSIAVTAAECPCRAKVIVPRALSDPQFGLTLPFTTKNMFRIGVGFYPPGGHAAPFSFFVCFFLLRNPTLFCSPQRPCVFFRPFSSRMDSVEWKF